MKHYIKLSLVFFLSSWVLLSCNAQEKTMVLHQEKEESTEILPIKVGAEVLIGQLDLLKGKTIALVVNPTSMVNQEHLVDVLLNHEINIVKVFAPEHGFRGTADAGEKVNDGVDQNTGLPLVSLYGKHKKPNSEDLKGVDIVVFDIQDVGARFYTYISTLHYVMEACAEHNVEVLVLDRPNPNGDVVDGNVLDTAFSSFVGMHPIPVLHGMTVGEYALMINGEAWLADGLSCSLEVLTCENYSHNTPYSLPVKPSPNLPNDRAIALYPSTCFFEGTVISEGRGTDFPFQVFGAPSIDPNLSTYTFTPKSKAGAKYPKFENKLCYGFNISSPINDFEEQKGLNLAYLITMYNLYPEQEAFFLKNGFFDLLAGGSKLREAIVLGLSAEEIKASWQEDLNAFKSIRSKYLLYEDFE